MERFISKSLINLRKSKKLTQTQFGKMLGMSRSKVSSWEVGRRDLSVSDAIIISEYFNMSLDVLLNPRKITSEKIINCLEYYINYAEVPISEKQEVFAKIEEIFEKLDELVTAQ